jgi:hypothetical protein
MESEQIKAIGPRGEACIILMRRSSFPCGETVDA